MHTAITVALWLLALLTLSSGVAALTGGWVSPWLAPKVVRPWLYGIGQLLYGGFTVILTVSRIEYGYATSASWPVVPVGVACAITGGVLTFVSRRQHPQPSDGQQDLLQ